MIGTATLPTAKAPKSKLLSKYTPCYVDPVHVVGYTPSFKRDLRGLQYSGGFRNFQRGVQTMIQKGGEATHRRGVWGHAPPGKVCNFNASNVDFEASKAYFGSIMYKPSNWPFLVLDLVD